MRVLVCPEEVNPCVVNPNTFSFPNRSLAEPQESKVLAVLHLREQGEWSTA
jgi:hypothetical protein